MKTLFFLSAGLLLTRAEYYLTPYTPATREELCSILLWAASYPDPCFVGTLEQRNPGVWKNSTVCNYTTPLHAAVTSRRWHSVRILLAHGADLDAKDLFGRTALHYAVNCTLSYSISFLLLHAGADPDVADRRGETPLHVAVKAYARNFSPNYSSYTVTNVRNSLRKEHVVLLLAAGANRSVVDSRGETPVSIAAEARLDIVEYMLGHWNISLEYPQEICQDFSGVYISGADQLDGTANGVDRCGRNELFRMVANGYKLYPEILNKSDINTKDLFLDSALHVAIRLGSMALMTDLVTAGANVNATDWLGATPLHYAKMCRRDYIVDQLLADGANPTARDMLGRTPDDMFKTVKFKRLPKPI